MTRNLLSGILLFLCACYANGQSNSISWEYNYDHFGIQSGLPSSETYQVYQDRSGLLWILSDGGVVSYDGFNFKTYTTETGLCDNVNFRVFEDPNGGVWFIGYNGLLSVYRNGKMQAYKYNSLLKKAVNVGRNAYISFCVEKDSSLTYSVYGSGIVVRIDKKGRLEFLSSNYFGSAGFVEVGDNLLCSQVSGTKISDIFFIRGKKRIFAGKLAPHGITRTRKHKGVHFIITGSKLYLHDKQQFKLLLDEHEIISLDSDKQFVYIGFYKGGLKKYRFDPKTKELIFIRHYFPDYSVSSAINDQNNTLWITTLEKGVFAIPDEAFKQLIINGDRLSDEVRFITGNRNKIIITHYTGKWQQLYAPYLCKDVGKIIRQLNLLPVNNGFAFQKGFVDWSDWKDVDATYDINPNYTDNSFVVGVNFSGTEIKELNGKSKYLIDLSQARESHLSRAYVWFYIMQHKKAFAVYDTGLNVFDIKNSKISGKYRAVLNNPIRKIKYNKDWGLLALTYTNGIFRVDMDKEVVKPFASDLKLGNQVLNIFFDEKNQLWMVSKKGIYLLVIKNGRAVCKKFLNEKMLSSAEVTDLYAYNNVVYLTTKFGVQKIDFLNVKKQKTGCPIKLFSIHGFSKNKEFAENKVFSSKTDLIKISLLNKNLDKNLEYRYRFGADETWIRSNKGEIILNNPSAGNYNLEISSLNTFNKWTDSQYIYSFTVEKIIFLRWYFLLLYIILVIAIFYIILKLSIQSVNKKNYMLNRMKELEQMALSAQMNPHFIFNSLNSIHSFLLYEENENAEKYLLRFAKLIRQTLSNSRATYITIEEEYETLKNYILIESMRFKDSFDFQIECDLKKLPLYPCIPPMLIQPYVENAIVHGLAKRANGAKLRVKFYMEDDLLKVLIEDNGIGYAESKKNRRDTGHKSYGTQITEERLKSLRGNSRNPFTVSLSNLDDSDAEFPGTCVVVVIPIPVNQKSNEMS